MTFFKPDHFVRRLIYSLLVVTLWLSAMYLVWLMRTPWLIAERYNQIPSGLLHPMDANLEMGRIHRIHPANAFLAAIVTALVTWGFYMAHKMLVQVGDPVSALRRRVRIKRGLCARCAYPVGTNDKCTECGATLAKGR